jgi:hypothetical protein
MKSMIATVGSNPMPVALLALHCNVSEIHLIYTEGVAQTRQRLEAFFKKRNIETRFHKVSEDQNLVRLTEDIKKFGLPQGAGLNYTAGTKHMSVAVHHAVHEMWSKSNHPPRSAYLSGSEVLWDNQAPEKLKADIELEEILNLHFDQALRAESEAEEEVAVAQAIYRYIKSHSWDRYKKLLPPLHEKNVTIPELECAEKKYAKVFLKSLSAEDPKNFKPGGAFRDFSLADWLREIKPGKVDSVEGLPKFSHKPEKLLACYKLLYSEWLELWLLQYLRDTELFDEVIQGVKFTKQDDDPEIDLLARKDHRLFLISCTTDGAPYLVKHKAFEAFQRSRRLGGDLTRYAVFSFASSKNLTRLITTVEDERWEGAGLFRAFGYDHLIGEAGPCKKGENNHMTLQEALKDWLR